MRTRRVTGWRSFLYRGPGRSPLWAVVLAVGGLGLLATSYDPGTNTLRWWWLALGSLAMPLGGWWIAARMADDVGRTEQDPGRVPTRCPGCGYALKGLPSDRCPECGEVIAQLHEESRRRRSGALDEDDGSEPHQHRA